jgi:hypothetical protein
MKLWPASRRPGGQSRHQESTPVEQAPAHRGKATGMGGIRVGTRRQALRYDCQLSRLRELATCGE